MSAQPQHGVVRSVWDVLRRPIPPALSGELFSGWLILLLFLLQVLTGILLSIYFEPSPATVADSVEFLMRDVGWGWLVRGVHHWSAQLVIVLVALQLLVVLVRGRYRGSGAASWYVVMLVLYLLVASTYSGELLVWDQESYWRVARALQSLESFGPVGRALAYVVRGGDQVTATTLSRTYTAHGMFLPWLVFVLLMVNLWLLARRIRDARGAAS